METDENIPKHIAVIPDGNRRWALQRGITLLKGYSIGVQKIVDISLWAKEYGVKMLTIWALSTDNIKKRSRMELSLLYTLYTRAANDPKILRTLEKNRVRVKVIGSVARLPARLRAALANLESLTRDYSDFCINLLIGYGGREDMVEACRRAYEDGRRSDSAKRIDKRFIERYMKSSQVPDADLIIRTSGEMRLSGLLPWQATYAELYFESKRWPEFEKADLKMAIDTFSNRKRRFGT